MSIPRKYGFLRFIAFVLKLLAWLVLLAGIASAVLGLSFAAGGSTQLPEALRVLPLVGAIAGPVIGVVWFVQLFAFGSVLSLLVDIEQNTRRLAAESTS